MVYGKIWPLFEMITNSGTAPNKVIDDWVAPLVKRALESKSMRGSEKMAAEEGSLVDHLADMLDSERAIRDEVNIISTPVIELQANPALADEHAPRFPRHGAFERDCRK